MTEHDPNAVLEFEELRDRNGDPELEAVKAAIFLEDTYGLELTDAEIDPAVLGTSESMLALLEQAEKRS